MGQSVVACIWRITDSHRLAARVRYFDTTAAALLALADGLAAPGVRPVAMVSTAVYGKPILSLLELRFAVMLVPPRQIVRVPRRKTDVIDGQWSTLLLVLRPARTPLAPRWCAFCALNPSGQKRDGNHNSLRKLRRLFNNFLGLEW